MNVKIDVQLDKFVIPLQILFIALKLMGYISWKWVWVLAPTWMGVIVWLILFVAFTIYTKRRGI